MNTKPKKTTATVLVTVSGAWFHNGKQVTPAKIEKAVRQALRNEFEFLAETVKVRRVKDGELA